MSAVFAVAIACLVTGGIPIYRNEVFALREGIYAVNFFCFITLGACPIKRIASGDGGFSGSFICRVDVGINRNVFIY